MRYLRIPLTAILLALLLALPGMADEQAEVVEIIVKDYEYQPAELTIAPGTTVRWVNQERRANHDVYFPDEDIGSPRFFPEESWERTFDEPGEYPYHCRPHEDRDMHGMIRVEVQE